MNEVLPRHLGFIVDGNRRWAKERGLPTFEGHRRGLNVVEEIATEVFRRGVEFATFYIFSTENWNRSAEEVEYLMAMAQGQIVRLAKKMKKNNVRLAVLGSRERVSRELLAKLDEAETLTADCTGGTMGVCFNYGGRSEIVEAVNNIILSRSSASADALSEEDISSNLYHSEIPDVDMIVRTSGEERISGFMLWRAAYAEMMFMSKYWPDMGAEDVSEILAEYASRQRRFGK
jgi:undecaprenyl diphosphate synthase